MSTTPAPEIDLRDSRLAELVAGLTGCDEHGALHALREDDDHGDALERVASAILTLEGPAPGGLPGRGLPAGRSAGSRRPLTDSSRPTIRGMPDKDLERPSLIPPWLTVVVILLAIFGAFALVSWVVHLAFGIAKGLFFIVVVIGVIAALRAVARRR